jgi:hypothetical protein
MRRAFIIALALFAAAAAAVGVTAAITRTPDSSGVSRVERVSSQRWGGSCDLDACAIVDLPIPYTTPAGPEAVDMTVALTLTYRTTGGASAYAGLSLDDGTPPYERMRPSSQYPLRPSTRLTSTTLTWLKRDVPAAGKTYTFHFSGAPGFGGHSSVVGTKLAIVIESWTAGD